MSQENKLTEEALTADPEECSDAQACETDAGNDAFSEIMEKIGQISETVDAMKNDDRVLSEIEKISRKLSELSEKPEPEQLEPDEKPDPVSELAELVREMKQKQDNNERRLSQALRENANFQIQVRSGMQHDLDDLKKRVSGEQYIPILKEISEMYVDYYFLTQSELSAEEMKKNLLFMFSQFEDIFEEYGASVLISKEGSPRKSHCCRIVEKIATADQDKHNTVAKSRKPGVIKDKTVLQPEYADVYVYDPSLVTENDNKETN